MTDPTFASDRSLLQRLDGEVQILDQVLATRQSKSASLGSATELDRAALGPSGPIWADLWSDPYSPPGLITIAAPTVQHL